MADRAPPTGAPGCDPAPGADELRIRPARSGDLARLPDIERAAGELFRNVGMAAVADGEPPTVAQLDRYRSLGRCWVAADHRDHAVGYAIAGLVDRRGHVEQVSVDPRFARRGVGRRLLEAVEQWAVDQGRTELTLTTFIDVAWNGPYYRRCGFRYIDDAELSPELRSIRRAELDAGLDRWPRAAMIKRLG